MKKEKLEEILIQIVWYESPRYWFSGRSDGTIIQEILEKKGIVLGKARILQVLNGLVERKVLDKSTTWQPVNCTIVRFTINSDYRQKRIEEKYGPLGD